MEIHDFEKVWLGASLLLIVGFVATIAYGAVGAGVAMVDDSGGQIDAESVSNGETGTPFDDPGVRQESEDHYVVYVVARQFQFEPGTSEPIRVPADTRVTFRVTSADVTHGFSIAETNVNVMVIPGQVSEMTVEFDETGRYGLVCHEYCGAAHHAMGGAVVVEDPESYDSEEVTN